MSESKQQVLSRVRPPRVQITYDVETLGSIQKKELPFIVGILADLSGKPENPLPRLKERKFVEIDRDNFDDVMGAIAPRLAFQVANKLQPDSNEMISVLLSLKKMGDFSPDQIVQQIPALKKLFDARSRLNDLLAKLDGNDDLDGLLGQVLADTAEQAKLREDLKASSAANPASPPEGGAPTETPAG
ncbi:type VI secretion system contractile sheath small subunit [Acidibrevibacterium fodinaquatile]|uniref:type VI secretion system contractile sheath small subunit n=1 Tax=Acidibrevibacterium fodinaquatile TaxID=1969806 RepID=UPI000E0DD8F5|nr:type VI secretion system contractile sheath small subunit [Acidibrevibacterium fodinaquatile]